MTFIRISTGMIGLCALVFSSLFVSSTPVVGNESKPCFGECNLAFNSPSASGILRISGAQPAVSDITFSAGWRILDCDSSQDAVEQDIRLACQDPSQGCAHVYQNGAEDTLVRLPVGCGPTRLAIVTREWTHDNQTLPEEFGLASPEGTQPVVKGMSLTMNFGKANTSRHGAVNLFLMGSSIPGVIDDLTIQLPVDTEASTLRSWVNESLHTLAQAHADLLGNFNKSTTGASPIDLNKTITLFEKNMTCPQRGTRPAFLGQLFVDLEPSVNGTVSYGVSAAGSIISPQLDEFGFFVDLNATIATALNVGASLTGTLSSGAIPLFSVGLPELSFPKILSIGPTFSVDAEATATIDTYFNLSVSVAYDVQNMQVLFTPGSHSQTGIILPRQEGGVMLSASPSVSSQGQLAAHLIPSIAFGIDAFGGKVQTTVSVNIDADITLNLSLSGTLEVPLTVPGQCRLRRPLVLTHDGCVDVSSGFSVNAEADADLFDIFKKGASVQLFEKDFDLYQRCLGQATQGERLGRRSTYATTLVVQSNNASCPAANLRSAMNIA